MNNEEKELLIIDLSARSSCGVMFQYQTGSFNSTGTSDYFPMVGIVQNAVVLDIKNRGLFNLSLDDSQCRPYLRPMSSMTEEEWKEYDWFIKQEQDELIRFRNAVKFYNKHHIDYNDLIPNGLALEAPKGMYNF